MTGISSQDEPDEGPAAAAAADRAATDVTELQQMQQSCKEQVPASCCGARLLAQLLVYEALSY